MTDAAAPVRTFALSFHAPYVCQERGACCTAGWPVPIEAGPLARARALISTGRLLPVTHLTAPFTTPPDAPADTPALVGRTASGCVFHHDHGVGRCALHRAAGSDGLPQACRQFPRVALRDPRGWSVTLSAFCPTVAALLEDGEQSPVITSTSSTNALSLSGLDVREGLPPALRPDMLMGWDDWWHWEARAIERLRTSTTPADGIDRLAAIVEEVRTWTPADGSLRHRIDEAFDRERRGEVLSSYDARQAVADLIESVPETWRPPARLALTRRDQPPRDDSHRRALIAHAFANWTAHLGEGLRTWLRSVEAVHVLLTAGVSVGDIDLVVRHLADPAALARRWGVVEGSPGSLPGV